MSDEALTAFLKNIHAATQLTDEIGDELQKHLKSEPEEIGWWLVRDSKRIVELLTEILTSIK